MYHYLAYPFDVAKTNRILNSGFNKECGENLGKELVVMYERGQFRNGAFRGVLPLAAMTFVGNQLGYDNFDATGVKLLAYTTITNPLNTLMTLRQAIPNASSGNFSAPGYRQILADWGANLPKLVTLGYTAALLRNSLLMTAFLPRTLGNESIGVDAGFAFGAVLLSHPFEVARVLIVAQERNRMIGSTMSTLHSLFAAEGVAGLYRGLIPRTIHTVPILFTAASVARVGGDTGLEGLRANPLLGSLNLSFN